VRARGEELRPGARSVGSPLTEGPLSVPVDLFHSRTAPSPSLLPFGGEQVTVHVIVHPVRVDRGDLNGARCADWWQGTRARRRGLPRSAARNRAGIRKGQALDYRAVQSYLVAAVDTPAGGLSQPGWRYLPTRDAQTGSHLASGRCLPGGQGLPPSDAPRWTRPALRCPGAARAARPPILATAAGRHGIVQPGAAGGHRGGAGSSQHGLISPPQRPRHPRAQHSSSTGSPTATRPGSTVEP
jgi:hypothetical protein